MRESTRRWQFSWAWVVGVTLFSTALACKIPPINPPSPPPTPPPVAHEPVCSPPDLVTGCWHQPPGEDWQFIPAPVPDPTVDVNCDGPVGAPVEPWTPKLGAKVNEAILAVYGCDGGRCVVQDSQQITQRKIIDQLRRMGLCAGQHGPVTDEIAVATSRTAPREGYHIYVGVETGPGTLLLSPQANRPAWLPSGAPPPVPPSPTPTPTPTPTPPPTPPPTPDACPIAPCPIKRWTRETLPPGWGDNEIGRSAWKWNARVHTMGNCDSTPVVIRQEPFLRAIGMSPDANGLPRAEGPVRPDGHPDRELVENWLLDGGPKRERCTAWVGGECKATVRDNQCDPNNTTNAFAFLAGTGDCRICNTPGTVCSAWF